MTQEKYWLGLSLLPNIGPARLQQLIYHFKDPARVWSASERDLQEAGLSGTVLQGVLQRRKQLDLDTEMARVEKAGAWLLIPGDPRYPERLRQLAYAPPVLYVRGTIQPEDDLALAVVGTRKATPYGRQAAARLSQQVAAQGVTIISGLAQGIDAAAHQGALNAGGRTFAVLGCGIDRVYPRQHAELAHQISSSGALISEFPLGTPPSGVNFPRRNRLISGLALGVLIVEAPETSGALITAEIALEQGREVFAVPGNIFNPAGRGTNRLIQDGAKLVTNVADILDELNIAHITTRTRKQTEQVAPGNETEARILHHLGLDPIHVDDLARLCELPIAVITSTLTILELKGLAQTTGQMQYCRTLS